jgi:hypothetical protein
MGVTAPFLPAKEVQNIARDVVRTSPRNLFRGGSGNRSTRILDRINARRLTHREHNGLHPLEEESLGAEYRIRLECGQLG